MSGPDFFYRIGLFVGRVIQAKDLGSMIYGKIDTNIDISMKRNDEFWVSLVEKGCFDDALKEATGRLY